MSLGLDLIVYILCLEMDWIELVYVNSFGLRFRLILYDHVVWMGAFFLRLVLRKFMPILINIFYSTCLEDPKFSKVKSFG